MRGTCAASLSGSVSSGSALGTDPGRSRSVGVRFTPSSEPPSLSSPSPSPSPSPPGSGAKSANSSSASDSRILLALAGQSARELADLRERHAVGRLVQRDLETQQLRLGGAGATIGLGRLVGGPLQIGLVLLLEFAGSRRRRRRCPWRSSRRGARAFHFLASAFSFSTSSPPAPASPPVSAESSPPSPSSSSPLHVCCLRGSRADRGPRRPQ